jgi:uncharacterized protein YdhG (YjbR/CyaY superfamily)
MAPVSKVKSGSKSSAVKRKAAPKAAPKTVEEYSALVPEAARSSFDKLRATVRSAVPAEATEVISYGIPALDYDGVLVWYAAFSNHCSLFPTASVIEAFMDELKDFSLSKGTIHFPLDKPLPTALIRKMVKGRVKEKTSGKRT